jgi:xanthine/CO dehydrogenase XdhC/CoxF family maturation factor
LSKSIHRLLSLLGELRAQSSPMVWAVVARTAGPTYAKAGAQMLIAPDGRYAGLLSGGCLEGDLAEHARAVLTHGRATLISYDMRTPDDLLFGLGSGCEGAMDILLTRLDASRDWQPLSRLAVAWRERRSEELLLVIRSSNPDLPAGTAVYEDAGVDGKSSVATDLAALRKSVDRSLAIGSTGFVAGALPGVDVLKLCQAPPAELLVLGAGPDAQPLVTLAAQLGWRVTVVDHRSHYARNENFPAAAEVLDGGPAAVVRVLRGPVQFAAAVVMSHHLASDLAYLRALAGGDVAYVGLLGPAIRREKLLSELGEGAALLSGRLRSPVGLDLGADTPEAIALAIVAEIHAVLAGRTAVRTMSERVA